MADPAFTWGDSTSSRRRLAEALLKQGTDTAPVQSWTQGLARVTQALLGGMMARDEDGKEKDATALLLQNPALTGATPVVTPDASAPVVARPVAMLPGNLVPNDANALPGTVGMDQRLADASQDFIQDNPGTSLSSGVRTPQQQAVLYANRLNNPNPVAPPGTSLHETGMAADIGGMTPDQRAQLPQYGLAQPVANDPVHVQLAGDPSALPANAMPTQGYAIPGQAPSQGVARVGAQMSPQMSSYVRTLIGNPMTRASGVAILAQYAKPQETHSQVPDQSGNIWDVNNLTGQRTVALKKDSAPTSVQEYQYYRSPLQPGQAPMDYGTWSTAKARAGATNVTTTVGGENKGLDEAAKLDAEAVRKGQNEQMPALSDADRNFQIMQDAIDRNGGKLPTGGALGQLGLNARQMSGYIRDNWGVDLGDDPTTTTALETLNKGGIKASGDMAKAIGGNRVLKVEFDMAQRANPGLSTSDGGNKYLIDVNRNAIAIQRDHLQAQEDYWREHNHSLDGFQKSWNAEVRGNPRPLSTFSVTPPIDNGDGSQMVKLPSTSQSGYSWYQKGPDGLTPVADKGMAKQLDSSSQKLKPEAAAPVEKTIGGKTYVKQDGNWFEKH